MKNFHKDKIYHYTSSPIDFFEGYVWMPDLKDRLVRFYEDNGFQTLGIRYWLDMAMMLLKRCPPSSLTSQRGFQGWRCYDIFFDVIMPPQNDKDVREIESIHLILKEDNNGTVHLFTFDELLKKHPQKCGDYLTQYDARHEYDADWELEVAVNSCVAYKY